MIKACIFDLDGVIVDTAKFHFLAWQELAHSLGVEFTEEHNENLKGVGRMESLEYILELGSVVMDQESKLSLANSKNEQYKKLILDISPEDILPGVKEFIEELREAGLKIALGSSSKNARPVLDYLQLKQFFDVIIDGTDISRSKPDPQVFEMGAEALNIAASEIVVFEDAQAGIDAARAGGFRCIGIGRSEDLSNADHVMEGFSGFSIDRLSNLMN